MMRFVRGVLVAGAVGWLVFFYMIPVTLVSAIGDLDALSQNK
jgi:hypothetical protein